jgi:hypothetical protein
VLVGEAQVMTVPGDEIAAAPAHRGLLRASHVDREQVIDTLKAAFVQGRLDKDEFDARVGQAFASRTYAELAAVTADIPAVLNAAQLPRRPARAQTQSTVKTDIQTGVRVIIVATVLAALLWVVAIFVDNGAAFIAALGATGTVLVASALTGSLMLGSWLDKRPGRQLPPRPVPGAGGKASHDLAADPAVQLPRTDHGQQHIAEAARRRLIRPQLPGSRPPRRWGPRGRRYAIGYPGH